MAPHVPSNFRPTPIRTFETDIVLSTCDAAVITTAVLLGLLLLLLLGT